MPATATVTEYGLGWRPVDDKILWLDPSCAGCKQIAAGVEAEGHNKPPIFIARGIGTAEMARLIAAAPAMLEALRDAQPLILLAVYETQKRNDMEAYDRYVESLEQVEAAIAKARGESDDLR